MRPTTRFIKTVPLALALGAFAAACSKDAAGSAAGGGAAGGGAAGGGSAGGGSAGGAQDAGALTWASNATAYRGMNGAEVVGVCPPGSGSFSVIYGTDIYTDDSSICTTAVHFGAIRVDGGVVRVRIEPGQSAYVGSTRNGVTSDNYPSWPGSYTFN